MKSWKVDQKRGWQGVVAMLLAMALAVSTMFFGQLALAVDGEEGSLPAQEAIVNAPRVTEDTSLKSKQYVVWDTVWFGSYPQAEVAETEELLAAKWDEAGDAVVGGQKYRRISQADVDSTEYDAKWAETTGYRYFIYSPIKWRVLQVDGAYALLLSDMALDEKKFLDVDFELVNPNPVYPTWSANWETSTLRSWLNALDATANQEGIDYSTGNKSFMATAFADMLAGDAQLPILDTTVVTNGSEQTNKIFLLGNTEVSGTDGVRYGFRNGKGNDESRYCVATAYAKAMGVYARDNTARKDLTFWWLRTQADKAYSAHVGSPDGQLFNYMASHVNVAVRPAIWVDTTSPSVKLAGTIDNKGVETIFVDISAAEVSVEGSFTYNGQAHEPTPTVIVDGVELEYGVDYDVTGYEENSVPGTAIVKVAGKGTYKGSASGSFTIDKAAISSVTLSEESFVYTGQEIKPTVMVHAEELELTADDYVVSYDNNIDAGNEATLTVTATETSYFTGSKSASFTITPAQILSAVATPESFPYNGEAKTPEVKAYWGVDLEVPSDSYDVSYENNIEMGTARAKVTGKGNFEGTVWANFTIGASEDPCFKDVAISDWFHRVVHRCKDLNLIEGYSGEKKGFYGPNDKITRAQIVVILWRMSGRPTASGAQFKDVSKTDKEGRPTYYYNAVLWAKQTGVVSGYPTKDGSRVFKANQNITKEELAVMLNNYVKKIKGKTEAVGTAKDYAGKKDAGKVQSYAQSAVGWAFKQGLYTGDDEGYLRPQWNATRAAAAKMVLGLYEYVNK